MNERVLHWKVWLWPGWQVWQCQCFIVKYKRKPTPRSSDQSIMIQMFQLSRIRYKLAQISTPVLHSVDSRAGQHCRAAAAAARVIQNIWMRPLHVYVGKIFLFAASLSLFMLMSIYLTITIRDNCVHKWPRHKTALWYGNSMDKVLTKK